MVPSWCRPTNRETAYLGVAAFLFTAGATPIGHQDLGGLMASQPAVADHWREHLVASPFGTIHASVFSLRRPLGTSMPEAPGSGEGRIVLASADPSIGLGRESDADGEALRFPSVNRSGKGDLLLRAAGQAPGSELDLGVGAGDSEAEGGVVELRGSTAEREAIARLEQADPASDIADAAGTADDGLDEEPARASTLIGTMQVFFDNEPIGPTPRGVEPWADGEAPILNVPTVKTTAVALALPQPAATALADKGGAGDDETRGRSPAAYFQWSGKARERAERCLANAVYFEARSEPVRGQIAVAQVVLNRAFSGYYPDDVCGVVYQNAHRHLSCQFTFACDGIRDVTSDPESWARARRIARETLDGKLWLGDVGKSTHYHAYYVRPHWARSMRKLTRIGAHTFYRPRKWGDGADAPAWGSAALTQEAAARL